MKREEFLKIRHHLGKTQLQMARLLGTSLKAIQSLEQGWRNIPVYTERQVLFLLVLKESPPKKNSACWVIRKFPMETMQNCPAWERQAGNLCWFIMGRSVEARCRRTGRKR